MVAERIRLSRDLRSYPDPMKECLNSAPGRLPLPIRISISGYSLTRKQVIKRAAQRLSARKDFRTMFSPTVNVKTVNRDDKIFIYIVQFEIFFYDGPILNEGNKLFDF